MPCNGVVPVADRAAVVTRGGIFRARSPRRSRSAEVTATRPVPLRAYSTSPHSKCTSVPKSPSRTFLTRSNADAGGSAPGTLVGDPSEALPDGDQRSAAQAGGAPSMRMSKFGFVAVLASFAAVLAANEALTNSGAGLSPAVMLVGVTGFEPAASSSRTGDHSSLPCC